MEIKLVKLGIRIYFTLNVRRIMKVRGVNNKIDPETYFLMWDFDDVPLSFVIFGLLEVQERYNLPDIVIISTGKEASYHAYCFKACSWLETRGIVAVTPNVDRHYLMAGIGRGYFTLRFTEIKGRSFEPVLILPGDVKPDLGVHDVNSFVEYTKAVKS